MEGAGKSVLKFRQMKSFFKELLEYNHHFNQKLGDIFNEHPNKTSEKAIQLYSHILNAHQIWNNRIAPKQRLSQYGKFIPFNTVSTLTG